MGVGGVHLFKTLKENDVIKVKGKRALAFTSN